MSVALVREPEAPAVPLLVTIPHSGTDAPEALVARWTAAGRRRADTDWHLGMLYDFVPSLGAALVVARSSRYVVDLNRPEDGSALYQNRRETGIIPTTTFDDQPIYLPHEQPDAAERAARVETHWRPWHALVRARLEALKEQFGYAILFDAHSIQSEVPRFYAGRLPDLMLGTADGSSCAPALAAAVEEVFVESPLDWTLNHPFKGGHITRSFGQPADGIHALQLEMSQRLYMAEGPPYPYLAAKAATLKPWLKLALSALSRTRPG